MEDEVGGRDRPAGRAVLIAEMTAVILALCIAWWIVALPSFSWSATVAVLAAGIGAAILGSRFRRKYVTDVGTVVPWVVLVVVAGVWELAAYLQHPRAEHPTVSSLVNELLDSHPARAVAFVLWLGATAALARR